jgi:hypothetical protein
MEAEGTLALLDRWLGQRVAAGIRLPKPKKEMNRFSKAASAGGLFHLPRRGQRVLAT